MKKKILLLTLISTIILLQTPIVKAATINELQEQINQLLKTIQTLQVELNSLRNENTIPVITDNQINSISEIVPTFIPANTLSNINTNQFSTANIQTTCLNITDDLYTGIRDSQVSGAVSRLQNYLVSRGLLNNNLITGFFGTQTMQAVQALQNNLGIVSYGDPETTGFGRVGPATRTALQRPCTTSPSTTINKIVSTYNNINTISPSFTPTEIISTIPQIVQAISTSSVEQFLPANVSVTDITQVLTKINNNDDIKQTIEDFIKNDGNVNTLLNKFMQNGGDLNSLLNQFKNGGGDIQTLLDTFKNNGGNIQQLLSTFTSNGGNISDILRILGNNGGGLSSILNMTFGL